MKYRAGCCVLEDAVLTEQGKILQKESSREGEGNL